MATKLTQLTLDELSLVTRPANKDAKVAIWKRADHLGGGSPASTKEARTMSEKTEMGDLDAQIADLTKRLDEAEAARKAAEDRAAEADTLAKMTDEEKAYMSRMSEADKAKFMGMSADERKRMMRKAAEDDEVLKTDAGIVRKSDVGEGAFALFKAQHEALEAQRAALAKAEEAREMADLRKRADNFPHLPGDVDARARFLGLIDKASADTRNTALAILKAADEALAGAFTRAGTSVGKGDEDSAEAKLDKLAKARAEKDGIAVAKAYTLVLDTDEGRRLYSEMTEAA